MMGADDQEYIYVASLMKTITVELMTLIILIDMSLLPHERVHNKLNRSIECTINDTRLTWEKPSLSAPKYRLININS